MLRDRVLLVLACATIGAVSYPASAGAAVVVSTSGNSIVITGTGSNEVDMRFKAPDVIQIVTQAGDSSETSNDCAPSGDFNPGVGIDCSNLFGDVQATFGSGNDTFAFTSVCFGTATIALGDGTNGYHGTTCSGSTTVTGGSGEDTLTGDGDASSHNSLFGGGGVDTLTGGNGDDDIHGGDGSDASVSGTGGNDQLFGDAGDDVIRG